MSTATTTTQEMIEAVGHRLAGALVGVHGVTVVGIGVADEGGEEDLGPTGVFADIAAHSVQAAEFAEAALCDLAGISSEAWAQGWVAADAQLRIRIYPGA